MAQEVDAMVISLTGDASQFRSEMKMAEKATQDVAVVAEQSAVKTGQALEKARPKKAESGGSFSDPNADARREIKELKALQAQGLIDEQEYRTRLKQLRSSLVDVSDPNAIFRKHMVELRKLRSQGLIDEAEFQKRMLELRSARRGASMAKQFEQGEEEFKRGARDLQAALKSGMITKEQYKAQMAKLKLTTSDTVYGLQGAAKILPTINFQDFGSAAAGAGQAIGMLPGALGAIGGIAAGIAVPAIQGLVSWISSLGAETKRMDAVTGKAFGEFISGAKDAKQAISEIRLGELTQGMEGLMASSLKWQRFSNSIGQLGSDNLGLSKEEIDRLGIGAVNVQIDQLVRNAENVERLFNQLRRNPAFQRLQVRIEQEKALKDARDLDKTLRDQAVSWGLSGEEASKARISRELERQRAAIEQMRSMPGSWMLGADISDATRRANELNEALQGINATMARTAERNRLLEGMDQLNAVIEQTRTPLEKFEAQMAALNELREAALMAEDMDMALEALNRREAELLRELEGNAEAMQGAAATIAGSAEAMSRARAQSEALMAAQDRQGRRPGTGGGPGGNNLDPAALPPPMPPQVVPLQERANNLLGMLLEQLQQLNRRPTIEVTGAGL